MRSLFSSLKDWVKAFLVAFILLWSVQAFWFELFTVPSSSMQNTLVPGDVVFVDKLSYGPRTTLTPFSIPFQHQTTFLGTSAYLDILSFPYWRVGNIEKLKHNDIIAFNYPRQYEHPVDHRSVYLKRCVALPGDTFELKRKQLFINGKEEVSLDTTLLFSYMFKSNKDLSRDKLTAFGIHEMSRTNNEFDWQVEISNGQVEKLKSSAFTKKLTPVFSEKKWDEFVFPYSKSFKWNKDSYGPLIIPSAGNTIDLNLENIQLYQNIITAHEENQLIVEDGQIMINDTIASKYTFKMNYYFVLGDNRDNSADSRFWGFLPENHIIGKVTKVVYSVDRNQPWYKRFRLNRTFQNIAQ